MGSKFEIFLVRDWGGIPRFQQSTPPPPPQPPGTFLHIKCALAVICWVSLTECWKKSNPIYELHVVENQK